MHCLPIRNSFKVIESFVNSDRYDDIVEITDKEKRYKVRLLKTKDAEPKIFMASLLNQSIYAYEELCELYRKRWEIEEYYKANKELFKVENFHSKKINTNYAGNIFATIIK